MGPAGWPQFVTVRPLLPADIPILQARAQSSGYPYPQPDDTELTLVVVDGDGQIITACAAKLCPEMYLWPMAASPAVAMQALQLLHIEMAKAMRELGYTEANAQLPPAIAAKFGRRLRRSFGWIQNTWDNLFLRF